MIKSFFQTRTREWVPVVFFLVLLIIGISMHRDYGLTWDDPVQRQLGLAAWDYVTGENDVLLQLINRYHNPVIELIEVLPEKILDQKSERAIYMSRHLVTFIFCWVGLIIFYLLALKIFKQYPIALLSCLLLVLTPRLFAHSFFNSKDLPFLSLFTASMYFLFRWIETLSWKNIFWLVIISGLLTGARILGVLFPILVLLITVISLLQKRVGMKEIKMIAVYFILYPVSVYLFFPTLWKNPIEGFAEALHLMSHYPFDVTTWFMGEQTHSLQTPWYYIPVWMGITIPVGWWIFFLAGFGSLVYSGIKSSLQSISITWTVVMLWLLLPLIFIIALHSNLYEDGRHMFFIYPAFILISVEGIKRIWSYRLDQMKFLRRAPQIATLIVVAVTSIYVLTFTIRYHPFQFAYFNSIGRKYAYTNFDKDYWGLSYRNALEFLVKYDGSPEIKAKWQVDPCEWNMCWLDDSDRQRIHRVKREECDYYITTFRSHRPTEVASEKIFEVKVQGITISAIYKMHPPNSIPAELP